MSLTVMDSITQAHKTAFDQYLAISEMYLQSAEDLSALNLSALKEAMNYGANMTNQFSGANSAGEIQRIQTEMANSTLNKVTEYVNAFSGIASKVQSNMAQLAPAQTFSYPKMTGMPESWQTTLSMMRKSMPSFTHDAGLKHHPKAANTASGN